MGFIEEFITTRSARAVYLFGVETFGFAGFIATDPGDPSTKRLIDDPGKELWGQIAARVGEIVRLTMRSDTVPRIQPGDFDNGQDRIQKAGQAVQQKLGLMFDPNSRLDPEDAAPRLMSALKDLRDALGSARAAVDQASAGYVRRSTGLNRAERQKAADAWTAELETRMSGFDRAGRLAAVAASVALEHRAVYVNDPKEWTWGKFALADAAEHLSRQEGDLPSELRLRDSDADLRVYLKEVAEGVPRGDPNDLHSNARYLADFATDLERLKAAETQADSGDAVRLAELSMAGALWGLGDLIDKAAKRDAELDGRVELTMVLTETTRGVLDMKRHGLDESRADEKARNPEDYEQRMDKARTECRDLAHRSVEKRKEKDPGRRDEERE